MEFLRSFLRNSTILQITSKKTSHAHHKLILTSLRFHARYKFLFPQRSSIGETRSDHVTRNASPRDKANWNLRVKTAALETILEVVEFWFMSVLADVCFCMRNEQLIYTRGSYEILTVFLNWCTCVHSHFTGPFKDLSILRIQRSYREIFTTHYDCRNGELSFIPLK